MLGIVSSDVFIAAVVLGVPTVVAIIVVLSSGGRLRGPALGGVAVVGVLVIAVVAFGVFRTTGPAPAVAAGGGGGLPPVVSPTAPPPSAPPPSASPSASATPTSSAPSAPCSPSGTDLKETAKNIAFTEDCLAAPAGKAFTISFDNEDAGVPHNIQILESDPAQDPNAASLFMGQLVTGPATATYQVSAIPAGTYYFHCDVHPTQMHGTFVVQ